MADSPMFRNAKRFHKGAPSFNPLFGTRFPRQFDRSATSRTSSRRPADDQSHGQRAIVILVIVILSVSAIAATTAALVLFLDTTDQGGESQQSTNRTILPDKVTENGDYDVVVKPQDFTRFETELQEPSDVGIDLEVPGVNNVTLAVYARHGQPPNHVLYDDMQKILDSPDKRTKRAVGLDRKVVSIKFLALKAGAWFFAFFNAGDDTVSLPGAIDVKKNTCPNGCSGHGRCRAMSCQCDNGWVGNDCSQLEPVECKPRPPQCSSHGQIQPDNTCTCDQGWSGIYCEEGPPSETVGTTACPPPQCSSHGQLQPDGTCQCDQGWSGNYCEEGPPSETVGTTACPPPQCSSHGQLQPDGTCQCDQGWSGNYCEEGESDTLPPSTCQACPSRTCSSHGQLDPDTDSCACDNGWSGDFCEEADQGTVAPSICPSCPSFNCSSHGQLDPDSNTCVCEDGWSGALCEEADPETVAPVTCPTCPSVTCSSHGRLVPETDTCVCEEGWAGDFCEEADPETVAPPTACPPINCSSHGKLNSETNKCVCEVGWSGVFCEEGVSNSNTDAPPTCPTCPPLKCSSHGQMNESAGTCFCEDGWFGVFCEEAMKETTTSTPSSRSTTPGGNGPTEQPVTFVAPGTFLQIDLPGLGTEYVTFTLPRTADLSLHIESSVDLSRSAQLAIYARAGGEKPNFALYDRAEKISFVSGAAKKTSTLKYLDSGSWILALYNGMTETVKLSVTFNFLVSQARCPEDCNGRGTCTNGVCKCTLNWGGSACAEAAEAPCIPNNCTVNGRFVDGDCICYAGWKGEYCDEADCVPSDCNGKGLCVAGQCQCHEGWTGDACTEADCIPSGCNDNGRCENAVCVCKKKWQGSGCATPYVKCPRHCSGHGTCDDTKGTCHCDETWTGSACDTKLCDDCSEFGECNNGTCKCQQGWTGASCRQQTCPRQCYVHGTCDNGTCVCGRGWAGPVCSSAGCPSNCSGNGECVQRGTEWDCQCKDDFKGADCSYGTESKCGDGEDNDEDGLTDCDDADCCSQPDCMETEQCGAGIADPKDLVQTNSSTTQSFADQVRFLYESGVVQLEVNVSTLDDQRLCVLRGRVLTQQLLPLPSVNVSVASKPKFGYSVSRRDGRYDMVLNCGGRVALQFNRAQFVGAQRTVGTAVWKYVDVSDTALVPLSTKVTEVDLSSNDTQLAEGASTVDEDGERNPSLIFKPGTKMVVRDMETGAEREVDVPHIRMTEFTVGSSGPESMPAELPSLVGYTYCTEISIDEATVDGSTEVHFNQPIAFYMENYLGFPVGTAVPVGYYNRTSGEWVAADNGRVVAVLSGFQLDVEGKGKPATKKAKEELGISEEELLSLRQKYSVGSTLWRATINHLTPYDCNFPYGPPPDGCSPSECDDLPDPNPNPCSQTGISMSGQGKSRKRRSLPSRQTPAYSAPNKASMRKLMAETPNGDLEEQAGRGSYDQSDGVVHMGPGSQYESWEGIFDKDEDGSETCAVTGEQCGDLYPYQNQLQSPTQMRLGILGTQLELHYNFYRQEGYKSVLSVPVSGPNLPDSVKNIFVEINVAGVRHTAKLPPKNDSTYTFIWNGRDGYDRRVNGQTLATIRIGYEYELVYYAVPRDFSASFNRFSSVSSTRVSRASRTAVFYVEKEAALSANELPDVGMGGWTLNIHHAFDAVTGMVYKGTGDKYQSRNENAVRTLMGTGQTAINCQACGEGEGTEARLTSPVALARGVNGELYVVDHRYIRKYDKKGIVSTIVALSWSPRYRSYMAVNPRDGAILLSDPDHFKIHRIDPETGKMDTFAGTGTRCRAWDNRCGDSGLATKATFSNPKGIAIGKDGNVFVVDGRRIRAIGTDGIITNYLGSNRRMGQNIGKPSDRYELNMGEAFLTSPTAITVDQTDESLYIVDGKLLLKLTREGKLRTAAGIPSERTNGAYQNPEQVKSDKAKEHQFDAPLSSVAMGPNAKLYLAETDFYYVNRIHQIDTGANTISQISGTRSPCHCAHASCSCFDGEGNIPINAQYFAPVALTVSPNGQVAVADLGNRRVRATKIRAENTLVDKDEYVVPDPSETRVHIFNSKGLHLRTIDLVTRATEYEFIYNEDEKLKAVVDRYNQTMLVERRSDGKLHAFVAPRGQRSLVSLNENGMLESLAAESGISAKFFYDDEGLMTEHKPPAGCVQLYEYTEYGRLLSINRGRGITQRFTEAANSEGTTRTASTLTGRLQIRQHVLDGSQQTTTQKIGVVQGRTIYDDQENELVKYQPSGMQMRIGYTGSAIWDSSILVPAYYHLITPVNRQEMLIEFEQTASFTDGEDPLSATGITKQVWKNGILTSSREENFVSRQANLYYHSGSSKYLVARERYDADRRVIYDVSPGRPLAERFTVYDDQQKLVTQIRDGISTWYKYNDAGKQTEVQGYDGLHTRYVYNSNNQVSSILLPSDRQFEFQYNECGNLVSIRNPTGKVHKLRTALSKRRRHEVYQSARDTPYSIATLFDLDGQLRQQVYASGKNTNYTSDEAFRPTSVQYDNTLIIYRYASGTTDPDFIYRYENQRLDSLISIKRDGMLVTGLGLRLSPGSRDNDAEFEYEHDSNFFVENIQVSVFEDSFSTTLSSDIHGKPEHHGTFTYSFPNSRKTQIGDGTFSCSYLADTHGVLSSHTCSINNVVVFNQTIERQTNDTSIVGKTVKIGDEESVVKQYIYDIDGQLISVKLDGIVSESYAYDADGNRVSWTDAGQSHTAKYDDDDRLSEVDGEAYHHNADGFLRRTPRGDLEYNTRGELTEYITIDDTTISYRYDGLHRLIERKSDGTNVQFVYGDHKDPVRLSHYVIDGEVNAVHYNLRGHAFAIQTNDEWYYIATDHVGTPLVIFAADGTVQRRMKYTSFGRVVSDSNPSFYFPIGFAGGMYDRETGLVHFFSRDYDPEVGQWTARDPSLFTNYQPNMYQYIFNDPINLRDPLGRWCLSFVVDIFWGGRGKPCVDSQGRFTVCGRGGVGTAGGGVGFDPLGGIYEYNGYSASVYGGVSQDVDGLIELPFGEDVDIFNSDNGWFDPCQIEIESKIGTTNPETGLTHSITGSINPARGKEVESGFQLVAPFDVGTKSPSLLSAKAAFKTCG